MPAPATHRRRAARRAAAAGLLALLAAAPAWACRFTAGGQALNLGTLRPSEGSEVRASVHFTASDCSDRELAQLHVAADNQVLGNGAVTRHLKQPDGPSIAYTLSRSLGPVVNRTRTLSLHAVLPAGSYSRARAGRYEDSLVVCLTP
ncbi:hypothetical protein ACT80S_13260 [Ramlibacter sp. MAHUQ-53]|uniref:hypothetical protein n=1 Tax=unclassified Ramlibacter TaxID=2617605 RepID=UPI0036366193